MLLSPAAQDAQACNYSHPNVLENGAPMVLPRAAAGYGCVSVRQWLTGVAPGPVAWSRDPSAVVVGTTGVRSLFDGLVPAEVIEAYDRLLATDGCAKEQAESAGR